MRSLILVAVILQLVIIGIKTDGKYQFGDIIEFPRACMDGVPMFSHYAIYVGPESGVNVGQGDNDIFHRRDTEGKEEICEFGKLHNMTWNSTVERTNYFDNEIPAGNRTTDKIKERIEEKKGKCEKYGLITNNCEHLVTYVRYGTPRLLQKGTCFGRILSLTEHMRVEDIKKYEEILKGIDILQKANKNPENDKSPCSNDPGKLGRLTGEHGRLTGELDRLRSKLKACSVALAIFCCLLGGLCVWWFVKRFKKRRVCSQEVV